MERNKDVLYFSHLPCYTVILHVIFIFKNCILSFMSFNENVTSDALELLGSSVLRSLLGTLHYPNRAKKQTLTTGIKSKPFGKVICVFHIELSLQLNPLSRSLFLFR